MAMLSADVLLAVWESGHQQHPIQRALALLEAAWPEAPAGGWACAPIGQRDCSLLGLHESLFGSELATTTHCPGCAARLESTFTTGEIRVRTPGTPVAPPPGRLDDQGYAIDYRLPTSADLL